MKNAIPIIAEAGLNHNGNLNKALKLIDIAKLSGADYVKFQLYKTSQFINKNYNHKTLNFKKIYSKFYRREFSEKQWLKIIRYAKKKKIKIFFSIFDFYSLNLVKKFKIRLIKIPSGEINNLPLLKKINSSKINVILSTGMSSLQEIKTAIKTLKNCKLTLLHCVSEYPTTKPYLNTINFLKKKFNKEVGFSDHTKETITPALAVVAGAQMIEKHFTYNKKLKLGDHKFSLNPAQLNKMVNDVRIAERFMEGIKKNLTKQERKLQFLARKGIYLNKNKIDNEVIKLSDISILRPEGKIKVSRFNSIINKKIQGKLKKTLFKKFV